MTRHFPLSAPEATAVPAMLIDAARCWRQARDTGDPVQPCLTRTLDAHGCTMLAPVLDSLCRFIEAALGRPMIVGKGPVLSDDEHLLLSLLDGPETIYACLIGRGEMARLLDGAIRSARIMVAMTMVRRPGREPVSAPPPISARAERHFAWNAAQHRVHRHDQRASA